MDISYKWSHTVLGLCDWLLSLSTLFSYKTPPLQGNLSLRLVLQALPRQSPRSRLREISTDAETCAANLTHSVYHHAPHPRGFYLASGWVLTSDLDWLSLKHKSPLIDVTKRQQSLTARSPGPCHHAPRPTTPRELLTDSGALTSASLENPADSRTSSAQSSACYHVNAQPCQLLALL